MSKIKKIITISTTSIILVSVILGTFYYNKMSKIVSTIVLDINPSISIGLNYKNKVVEATGLNEDGKEIIADNNFKDYSLEQAVKELTTILIEKSYINESNNHVLVNVQGNDIKKEVISLITNELKKNKIECNIIIQEVDEQAKAKAKEYGITESKAGYIQSIINEHSDVTFEDLKDKSINEINQIVEKENEQNQQEETETIPSTENQSTNNQSVNDQTTNSSTKVPSKDDKTGAWCDFYKTIPQWGGVEYETPGVIDDMNQYNAAARKVAPEAMAWSDGEYYTMGITKTYKNASYCMVGTIEVYNLAKDKKYTFYFDSVTLELLDQKVQELSKPTISDSKAQEIATQWVLATYGVDLNACVTDFISVYYGIDGITDKPEWQFSAKCTIPEIKYYAVVIDATTGVTSKGRTWN